MDKQDRREEGFEVGRKKALKEDEATRDTQTKKR
jgi:hypothetical protein